MMRESGMSFQLGLSHEKVLEQLSRFAAVVRADEREQGQRWFYAVTAQHKQEILAEREACAKVVGKFAQKWWSVHCASNKHMETTRKAHDDFCALQAAIRSRAAP
jgi:hypothetical protein